MKIYVIMEASYDYNDSIHFRTDMTSGNIIKDEGFVDRTIAEKQMNSLLVKFSKDYSPVAYFYDYQIEDILDKGEREQLHLLAYGSRTTPIQKRLIQRAWFKIWEAKPETKPYWITELDIDPSLVSKLTIEPEVEKRSISI